MPQPLLFPLNRISLVDIAALQFALRPVKLLQPAFMAQRLRAYDGRLAPNQPVNRPWAGAGAPSLPDDQRRLVPSVVHQLLPYPPTYFRIAGTTKDSTGAALGNCIVDWFDTATNVLIGTTTSDASGLFEFRSAGQPPNAYYLVAYKAGSPDVTGASVNTLVGT